MFNPKKTTGLASLFGGGGGGGRSMPKRRPADSDSDDYDDSSGEDLSSALTYKPVSAPRLKKPTAPSVPAQPTQQAAPAVSAPAPAPAPQQQKNPNALVWNCSLHAFKLNAGAYEPQGGGMCGCVIMGCDTSFRILIYDQAKTNLCLVPISVEFEYTLQENLYINFFSPNKENWSVRFMSEADYRGFALNVSLIKFHCAVFGEDALLTASFAEVLPASLSLKSGGPSLGKGDVADIAVSAWPLPADGAEPPQISIKCPPLPGTGLNIQGVQVSDGDAGGAYVIGGLGKALIGMTVGEEQLLLISPALAGSSSTAVPTNRWLVATLKVLKRTAAEEAKPPLPIPMPPPAAFMSPVEESIDQRSEDTSNTRERSDSLKERMARLSLAGSSNVAGGGSMAAALGNEVSNTRRRSRARSGSFETSPSPLCKEPATVPEPPGRSASPPTSDGSLAIVVHDEQPATSRPTRDEVSQLRQQSSRRPSSMAGRRMSTSPTSQYGEEFMDPPHGGYALQMLQMSSTSVERLVRDMESKVDKILQLQERNGSPATGIPSKGNQNAVNGEELLDQMGQYIKEANKAKADAQKHQEKSAELQLKVSELLEKNQEYVTSVIELREKHNDTLMKLSTAAEGHASSREEADLIRKQLSALEEGKKMTMESHSATIEALETEKERLIASVATTESECSEKVASLEGTINDLKSQLEEAKQNTATVSQQDIPKPEEGNEEVNNGAELKALQEELAKAKSAHAASIEASKKAVDDVKAEASKRMMEVVKKKTQKVMGAIYKEMGGKFQKGTPCDGEEVMQTLMSIMKETSSKMLK